MRVRGRAGSNPQEWHRQLQRCIVLTDDLQSGLLRPDASNAGVLPAASLRVLRALFYGELQRRLGEFALKSVSSAAAAGSSPAMLSLSLDLLGKVMGTVKSVVALPVRPPASLEAHSAAVAAAAVCFCERGACQSPSDPCALVHVHARRKAAYAQGHGPCGGAACRHLCCHVRGCSRCSRTVSHTAKSAPPKWA